ncbi:riboflavin synthase beta-chain [Legionella oakridgensis ATCC 33761 = DSM 21215]|uniref:Riboflavin synthase beta-chain n=1 Tax=Legionella oakridgensis ATCC 33761 = DSM 21215 TaxID=1268635 RepID=W0B8X5_9GAMM|nr:riboflavin synthase beta-chain [Legionella oakridgensis ATCC 33761 = DSM 21215]
MRYIKGILNEQGQSFPIAIVVSYFNQDITHELMQGAVKRLLERGFKKRILRWLKCLELSKFLLWLSS